MRDVRMDIVKGIGVLLVMINHMPSLMPDIVHAWVGGFDMALFFFVTGYFIKRQDMWGGVYVKTLSKFQTIIVPYIIYSLVFSFIYYCAGEDTSSLLNRLKNMVMGAGGYYMLWFLFSLFMMVVLLYVVLKISRNVFTSSIIVLIIVTVGFVLGKYKINSFKIGTTMYMFGFMYAGYVCKKYGLFRYINRYILACAVAVNILGSIFIFSISGIVMEAIGNQEFDILLNYIVAMSGIVVVVKLAEAIKIPKLRNAFAYIGKNSLYFYPLTGFIPDITTFAISDTTLAKAMSRILAFPATWLLLQSKERLRQRKNIKPNI